MGTKVDEVNPKKLKNVDLKFDCPPLSGELMQFVDWVAGYTLSPPGMVLRMVLRAPAALEPSPSEDRLPIWRTGAGTDDGTRQRVLELARDGFHWSKSGLAHAAGVSVSVVNGLISQDVLETVEIPAGPLVPLPDTNYHQPELLDEQIEIARQIAEAVDTEKFSVSLLDGVTGSGKTEVYFEAIAQALDKGKQVLILLPEIALTANFLERFRGAFWNKAGRMAFGHCSKEPRAVMASGGNRRGAGGCGRAFRPVPAV